jgi:hypothetical protein
LCCVLGLRYAAGEPVKIEYALAAEDYGKVDLLTAVLHELGHLAGNPDSTSGLMDGVLAPGVRQTQALDQIFARGWF